MRTRIRSDAGFSIVEVLVSLALAVTALGIALAAFTNMDATRDAATLMTDSNQSVRSSLNLMTRELLSAGRGIPVGGIPIPNGTGATEIVRPSAEGTTLFFPNELTLAAVTPGAGLGAAIDGVATDAITFLMADTRLALDSAPVANVAADGSSVTIDPSIPIDDDADGVTAGDLVMLTNERGSAIQMVTRRDGQTIHFEPGDPMNLNQPGAAPRTGSVLQLQQDPVNEPGVYPPTTARRILMVSYYVAAEPGKAPRLIRRENLREERAIGIGVENMQITFDLVDGVTNPVEVEAPSTPGQIRKANLFLAGRSRMVWRKTRQYLRTSLSTQVSLRSLSFVDRYNVE